MIEITPEEAGEIQIQFNEDRARYLASFLEEGEVREFTAAERDIAERQALVLLIQREWSAL